MFRSFTPFKPLFSILLLWMAGLGAAAQFAKISVNFAGVSRIYPDAGLELGLLVSLLSLLGILFGMTAGVILLRTGFRVMLICALLLGAVISLYQATLPDFHWMLASRIVEGFTHLVIVVAAPTLIARIAPDRFQGMAMTLWGTFFGVAFAGVAWIGLPLVDTYGLGALFDIHAAWMSGVALLLGIALRESERAKNATALTLRSVWHQHLRAYGSASMSAPAVGWFFYTVTFVSLLTILPNLLPPGTRTLIAGVMPLASIAVSLAGVSVLLRVMSAVRIILLGFGLATGLLVLLLAGGPDPVICVALFGALGLVQGASFAAVPELNRDTGDQTLANGAVAQMGNLGNTVGTPLLLMVLSVSGFAGMIGAVMLCYVCAALAHLGLARGRRLHRF